MVPKSWTTVLESRLAFSRLAACEHCHCTPHQPEKSIVLFISLLSKVHFIHFMDRMCQFRKLKPTSLYAGGGGNVKAGTFMKMGLSSPSKSSRSGVRGWSRRQSRVTSQ